LLGKKGYVVVVVVRGQVPIFHSQMQVAYMLWDTLFLSAFSSMNLKFLALFP